MDALAAVGGTAARRCRACVLNELKSGTNSLDSAESSYNCRLSASYFAQGTGGRRVRGEPFAAPSQVTEFTDTGSQGVSGGLILTRVGE